MPDHSGGHEEGMYCPNCGTQVKEGAQFCTNCGKSTQGNGSQEWKQEGDRAAEPFAQTAQRENNYPAPPAERNWNGDATEPLTVKQYVGMMFLMWIPIVNLILLCIWGFGGPVNRNKRNYSKAVLIMAAVNLAVSFVLVIFLAVLIWILGYRLGDYWQGGYYFPYY